MKFLNANYEGQLPQPPRTRIRSMGLTDAMLAAEWLNAARGSQMWARVLQIREELATLGIMLDSLSRKTQECSAYKGRTAPLSPEALMQLHEAGQLRERFRVRHNALNAALSDYALSPVMVYDAASGVWRYSVVSRKARGPKIQLELGGTAVEVDAASVVTALVRLAASRQLDKLRLCEQCQRVWRVSERAMDRFCSTACREAAYQQGPEFKDRRREILRRHREKQKERYARDLARLRAK